MASVSLEGVLKRFGRTTVVDSLSLEVPEGEFISLLGGSGCGKTTTLRMIAGFEAPSEGRVLIGGSDVTAVPPNRRGVGMVFQNYALFPNMSVRDNIAYGLEAARGKAAAIDARVAEMLALIHMDDLGDRFPHQLSGGQQQRVALARALAIRPRVLLLDEPLSALDAKIRVRLRSEIRAIQRQLGITTIYVTHDQEEALSLSDRVAVMKEGKIEQIGAPFEIYNRPATPFVGSFIGSLNVLSAIVLDPQGGAVSVDGQLVRTPSPVRAPAGARVRVSLRPESVTLGAGRDGGNRLEATVSSVVFLGSIVRIVVLAGSQELLLDTFNNPRLSPPAAGAPVSVSFAPEACFLLEGEG
jgi:putative spermidine/putrescine transport system ATP-binding protein